MAWHASSLHGLSFWWAPITTSSATESHDVLSESFTCCHDAHHFCTKTSCVNLYMDRLALESDHSGSLGAVCSLMHFMWFALSAVLSHPKPLRHMRCRCTSTWAPLLLTYYDYDVLWSCERCNTITVIHWTREMRFCTGWIFEPLFFMRIYWKWKSSWAIFACVSYYFKSLESLMNPSVDWVKFKAKGSPLIIIKSAVCFYSRYNQCMTKDEMWRQFKMP